MMERIAQASPPQLARTAGGVYLLNMQLPSLVGEGSLSYGIADMLAPAFAAHLVPYIHASTATARVEWAQ